MNIFNIFLNHQGSVFFSIWTCMTIWHCRFYVGYPRSSFEIILLAQSVKTSWRTQLDSFWKHKFSFCTFQLLLENMAEQKYWFRNVIQSSLYLKVLVSRSLKLNIRLKYCSWVSCLLSISSQFPIPFKVPGGHRGGLTGVVVTSAKPAVDNKVSGSHSRQTWSKLRLVSLSTTILHVHGDRE